MEAKRIHQPLADAEIVRGLREGKGGESGERDEKSFHAGFSPKPDGFTGSRALEAGECSFAYVRNVAVLDPDTPLVVFPLVKGSLKADTKLCGKWGNKAAVLFVDNRVITLPVDASGQVIFKGRDLFDPAQPFWHGTSPDVVWPE